jgi:hypothetical protein
MAAAVAAAVRELAEPDVGHTHSHLGGGGDDHVHSHGELEAPASGVCSSMPAPRGLVPSPATGS